MVAAFGVEVDDLLERVEALASIRSLRVEQEDVVAASGQLVTRELYELVLDVGDDEGRGLGAVCAVAVREQID